MDGTTAGTKGGGDSFSRALADNGVRLSRAKTTTLQVNVGLLCNQECRHCHLEAGPARGELMDGETITEVIDYARRGRFGVVDITGGAPEMNPGLPRLIEELSAFAPRIILRSNLTAISGESKDELMELLGEKKVVLFASLPSLNRQQVEAQRGAGVFDKSIRTLRALNSLGYGKEGTGLEINFASNPSGAFLPASSQGEMEKRFKAELAGKWGVTFNNLYGFANVPLGRFRSWLESTGNLERYENKLADSFNPMAVEGLMCRTQVSVAWDGFLYDCDFHIAASIPLGGEKTHVSRMPGPPEPGSPIATSDHCHACAAGAGFTCGGAIVS
ncbi:MAG: arsenosugar biosynthesis radical SAM (seleno)protein ArsS [Candidatus Nitrospinota bacterium M3_3B_026]